MRIIREVEYVAKILGRDAGLSYQLHAATAGELKLSVRARPDLGSDIVEWIMTNDTSIDQSCVLYRGVRGLAPPYYFGNAFYAVYYGTIQSNGTSEQAARYLHTTEPAAPLPSDPQGLYYLAELNTGSSMLLNCFVFAVPAKSSLSAYEGGIADATKAYDLHAFTVSLADPGIYCVHYNQDAVSQYERQTGFRVIPPPNPYQVETVQMFPKQNPVPRNEVFSGQYGSPGPC
ncbi:MAG: hypothetical protein QXV32_04655 [Conexivisphaerales archaeon]